MAVIESHAVDIFIRTYTYIFKCAAIPEGTESQVCFAVEGQRLYKRVAVKFLMIYGYIAAKLYFPERIFFEKGLVRILSAERIFFVYSSAS